MINTGLNVEDDANIKQSRQKKDANYYKENQINKCTVYLKTFHQNIRGAGKKAR
jgi:hypothetical protein